MRKGREARSKEAEQAYTIYGKTDWVDDKNGVQTFSLKHFCVLEDFKIEGLLQTKRKQRAFYDAMTAEQRHEYDEKPKLRLSIETSPLRINFSHYIYNRLFNLKHIFNVNP